ncbi:probable leucine-rich repeat-containing G-protein coupled receptor [Coccomyxa sp. Obi]|nr:probable leucine-rich repeat-containing G-protein coupled receptor [Coccomyxa sp. Obi]
MSGRDEALISALPDDILQKIFKLLKIYSLNESLLLLLSGVCKRWQALIFDPTGDLLNTLQIPWHRDNFSAAACGAWVHRHLQSGALHWPLHIFSIDRTENHGGFPRPNKSEEFMAILSCAGTALSSLSLYMCSSVFPSRSFPCLWAVPNLTELTLLDLDYLIPMDLFNSGMSRLRKLERFFIRSQAIQLAGVGAPPCFGLECFPEVLCTLPSLQSLQFVNQHLDQIPDGLSQLTRLSQLMIMQCVVKVPYGFPVPVLATLPSLQSLEFVLRCALPLQGHDPDAAATSKWKQMANIRDLSMSPVHAEGINCFPVEVAYLTKLQRLTLYDIVGIPQNFDISFLEKSLKVLIIESSGMIAFPLSMAALESLEILSVTSCTLKDWSLPALTGLHSLSVTYSNLREVPECFCNLTALKSLRLQGCEITKISPCISRLQKLCTLDLKGNYLSEVPQLAGLTALEVVQLHGNRMPKRRGVKRLRGEGGLILLPKMAVTESSLRWILQCRYIRKVYVNVSKEERAKLDGIRQELRRAFHGRHVLDIKVAAQYVPYQ